MNLSENKTNIIHTYKVYVVKCDMLTFVFLLTINLKTHPKVLFLHISDDKNVLELCIDDINNGGFEFGIDVPKS
jgi:hypothetical protein